MVKEERGIKMNKMPVLGENLEEGTLYLGKKTQELMDKMKEEMQIAKYKSQIKKQYIALGELVYSIKTTENQKEEEQIEIICNKISLYKACLEDLQKKKEGILFSEENIEPEENIDHVTEKRIKWEEKPKRNQEEYTLLKFCPSCQIGNHPDATTCISCGDTFPSK